MKKKLVLSFLILGMSSIIAQVIVLRELTVSFYGNEFFIGIILAFWLAWTAIGSGLLGNRFKKSLKSLIILHLLTGFFIFLEIFLIRFLKTWIALPGETPNLIYAFIFAALIPAPLCLILGLWWRISSQIFCKAHQKSQIQAINQAYFLEVLGFILGGILFSFFLFQVQEFLIAAILFLLNLAVIFFLILRQKGLLLLKTTVILLFLIFFFLIFSPCLDQLNQLTTAWHFKNQTLIESAKSPYGNIAVTKTNGQYNFYESGLLLGSTENIQFSEDLIHLSLLEHPSPKKVLLIGGGFNGALNEILKHPVEKIYYLELDPKIIEVSQKYIPDEIKKALFDQKVKIINTDGRYFLKNTQEKFDSIIINLPDPSTALINRFYSQEFFQEAKEKLNQNGILTTYLTFSPSAPGRNLENLNAALYKTLKKVFPQVLILPQETNFFLASQQENLTYHPEILIQRFKQRKIQTKFLNEQYINYRFSDQRIQKNLDLFTKNKQVEENKDLMPVAYFYQTLFWLDHFYPNFSNLFKNFASAFWLIFAGTLIISTYLLIRKREKTKKISPIFSMAIAGFSLMALEMIIIFSYQITIGYLYFQIALLIAALMTGMALGIFYGNKKIAKKIIKATSLVKFHLFLIIFSALLPLIIISLSKIPSMFITRIIFLFLAIIAGFLGSIIFPLSNKIYLSSQPQPYKKTGTIYSADLVGACLGTLLPALILIPVFGILQTLLAISIINLWIIFLINPLQKSGQ